MAETQIPKWMTQQSPNIASAIQPLKVVSPDDLQMYSQMYGKLANESFQFANQIGMSLNYLRFDYSGMRTKENYLTARESINKIRSNSDLYNDGESFRKAAAPVMDEAVKGMGYFEAGSMKALINQDIVNHSLQIDDNRMKMAESEVMQFKRNNWENNQKKYELLIDNKWDGKQKEDFLNNVFSERRKQLNYISEDQHKVLDKEFANDYDVHSFANNFVNSSLVPSEQEKILKSPELKNIMDDNGKSTKLFNILGKWSMVYDKDIEFKDKLQSVHRASYLSKIKSEIDSEPDMLKKRVLIDKHIGDAKKYDSSVVKGLNRVKNDLFPKTGTTAQTRFFEKDNWVRKGLNNEIPLDGVTNLYQQGKISGNAYNAYKSGLAKRKQNYDVYDKSFNSKIKSEFGFDLKSKSGKYEDIMNMVGNTSNRELKEFVLNEKANLMESKTNDVDYNKGLDDLYNRAKLKRQEIENKKQQTYQGKKPGTVLTENYGRKQ